MPIVITVDVDQLERIAANIEGARPRMKSAARKQLAWGGEQFVTHLRDEVAEIRYEGALDESIKVMEHGDNYVVIGADTAVAPHAQYVVEGGKPHAAPREKIRQWAESQLGADEELVNKVWWSIYYHGTSVHATRKGWGSDGENPFHTRLMERGSAAYRTIEQMALNARREVVAEIVS